MIEILVQYIQDKGYEVEVRPPVDNILPGHLYITKRIQGRIFAVYWYIPKHDLRPDLEECLYYEAHQRFNLIERAIAEYCESTV